MENTKSVHIISSELNRCKEFIALVEKMPGMVVDGFSSEGIANLRDLDQKSFDLLIADIEDPTKNDIRLLNNFKEKSRVCNIIMSTNSRKYAVNAFELGLVDYLLKPFTLARFKNAIKRFLNSIETESISGVFNISSKHQTYNIRINGITHIEAASRKSRIYTTSGVYEVAMPLKSYQETLPPEYFVRVHKKFIVNINFIERVKYYLSGRYNLFLNEGRADSLPVGAKFVEPLKQRIGLT